MRPHKNRFVPRTIVGLAAAAFTLPFTNSFAQASGTSRPPNVLFISFDDLSDWIQPLDRSSPIAMPQLDRLAQRGVMFRRAYCTAPSATRRARPS
jgi:predicted AlkP superfamily pyrophosphatase or phosphodiesterase